MTSTPLNIKSARAEQQQHTLAMFDQLDELLPHVDDEMVTWLITYIEQKVDGRPHDPRDPWSMFLRLRRPRLRLRWAGLTGHRGRIEQTVDGHRITLHATLNRAARRRVMAHELSHHALNNLWRASHSVDEIKAGEAETDQWADDHFDTERIPQ